jgi:tRNA-Thr(GGU) m(6)t(6)A37 methyltransferase TsaA
VSEDGQQAPARLTLEPIGYLRTPLGSKVEAARQPRAAAGVPGRIELLPGRHFEHALEDLAGWEYLWVLFWFHLNPSWRPKVLPPRSTSGRKGVFATRAPHRPNPLGLSALRLERVEGLTLHVSDVDLVDGTPVLDIKPYVPYTDAHPDARSGWLDDAADSLARGAGAAGRRPPVDPLEPWDVQFEPLAAEQVAWIEARTAMPLGERIRDTLRLGPAPHPYRRIRPAGEGFVLAVKDWRARFAVSGRDVRVLRVATGYRASQLAAGSADLPGGVLEAHRAFTARYGPG